MAEALYPHLGNTEGLSAGSTSQGSAKENQKAKGKWQKAKVKSRAPKNPSQGIRIYGIAMQGSVKFRWV
jgi:hypothetical protein